MILESLSRVHLCYDFGYQKYRTQKLRYQWSPNGWPLRGQTIGSVVCFLNIPNHNIYGLGLDDGWVHPNGCTRDRYRLGHQPVDSIILSDRVGSMYSQATVRLMISTLALGPRARVLIIKAELCHCSKATLKRWPGPWRNK